MVYLGLTEPYGIVGEEFILDVERGKTTAEIEKIIRLINVLGLNLLVEKRE